jgi:threonine dehydrogenase-like Zn-dependent dehydrogenase
VLAANVNGRPPLLVGKHAAKLALAKCETATVEDARALGRVFDIVIECSGGASGFELALAMLVPQGTLVLKSTFHGATPIDARVVVDEIAIIGSRCGRFADALEYIDHVDVTDFISEVVSIDRGAAALDLAAKPGVLKVLLAR